tara:strand:- start:12556 stop:13089 length:534 start_codon:yes stop_codon:yes gene_type:complete
MKTFRGPMNESDAGDFVERLGAMTVRARLDHSEKIARGILDYPDDPRGTDAEKILESVERARRALKRGWSVAGEMENLRRLSDAANWKIIGPHVKRGVKMIAGARSANAVSRLSATDKSNEIRDWYRAEAEKLLKRGICSRHVASILTKMTGQFEADHPGEKPREVRMIRNYLKDPN